MDWKTLYRELKLMNWIILLVLSSGSLVFWGTSKAIGVFLGGVIIILNFGLLQHTISKAFSSDGGMVAGKKASIILKYYLRLMGLGVILYFLVAKGHVDPVAMAVGLSTISLSILIAGIQKAIRIKNEGAI